MWLRNWDNFILALTGVRATGRINTDQTYEAYGVSILSGGLGSSSEDFSDGNVSFKKPTGSISGASAMTSYKYYGNSTSYSSAYSTSAPTMGSCNFCFGDGDTPATYEDFKLSGNVIAAGAAIRVLSKKKTWDAISKKFVMTATVAVTNNGSEAATVKEWGLCQYSGSVQLNEAAYLTGCTYSNTSTSVILMFREVLETPVIIEAGGTATFEVSIDFPMPNHP